jgi:hypothetical protein
MSDHDSYYTQQRPTYSADQGPVAPRRRGTPPPKVGWMHRLRPASWALLAFNALMLAWLIAGLASANQQAHKQCAHQQLQQLCTAATHTGEAIGAGIIVFVWVAGDVIGGVLWLVTNASAARRRRARYGID